MCQGFITNAHASGVSFLVVGCYGEIMINVVWCIHINQRFQDLVKPKTAFTELCDKLYLNSYNTFHIKKEEGTSPYIEFSCAGHPA